MKIMQRIRVWLQKPWFVGVLSLVAILFCVRNIALPLMGTSTGKQKAVVSSRASTPVSSQNSKANPSVKEASPVVQQFDMAEVAVFRHQFFSGGSYRRNPFLFGDDPRQPSHEVAAKSSVEVSIGAHTVVVAKPINPQRLFSLNAILVRDGQKYALINSQVRTQGDAVLASKRFINRTGFSSAQQQQLKELVAKNYTLTAIAERKVRISGPTGSFSVPLAR
ncbi:MAG: hypothetical protein DRQ54_03800 [Gammaproteobacteria bacterium]|nr:MAG: hypothetical protein DRQ54_03800 [Gammaproteobacteria bacterium]